MSSNFIRFGFTDRISRNTDAIDSFVNEVNDAYIGAYTRYKGNPDDPDQIMPEITTSNFVGRMTVDGRYEPLVNQSSLGQKLAANAPVTNLAQQSIIRNSKEYARSIYNVLNINTYNSRTYVGQLSNIYVYDANDTRLGTITKYQSASTTRLGGASGQGMDALKDSFTKMQERLAESGIQSTLTAKTNNFRSPGEATAILSYEIGLPQLEIDSKGVPRLVSDQRSSNEQLGFKKFTFTATDRGVIEAPSNLYINKSIVRTGPGSKSLELSSADTAAMMVETYARMQDVILDRGVSLAFNEFMQGQQRLGATQSYIELDRYLGRQIGYSSFTVAVNDIANAGDASKFLEVQRVLGQSLLSVSERDGRAYSQVSRNRLTEIRQSQISNILKPLGSANVNRESMAGQVIENLARTMLRPYAELLDKTTEVKIDAFTQLKLALLQQDTRGVSVLQQEVKSLQTKLLEQIRSPFLQPHSANYSGGQLSARRVYYSVEGNPLIRLDAQGRPTNIGPEGTPRLMAIPATYQHGATGLKPDFYIPISAQSTQTTNYSSRFSDSQYSNAALNPVSFFSIGDLFTSNAQIELTSLSRLKADMELVGYQGTAADSLIGTLKKNLRIKDRREDEEEEKILLLPYKKPEQIPQRLKNLTGTRPAAQYSYEYYKDVMEQKGDLNIKYASEDGAISRGKTLSGQIATVLPSQQFQYVKSLYDSGMAEQEILYHLREKEANPLAELRGFVGAEYQKRVLVQTGINQSSDYMHVNVAHAREAVYGYEQYTKIELEGIVDYSTGASKIFVTNQALDKQRALFQEAFKPGRFIFYTPETLKHEPTRTALLNEYTRLALKGQPEGAANILPSYKIVSAERELKNKYDFLKRVEVDQTGQIQFVLKEGLYGYEQRAAKAGQEPKQFLRSYGLFEEGTSRLIVGLGAATDREGNLSYSKALAVKISGTLRKDQKGVAVVNDQIDFTEAGGRLVGYAGYTILFDGSVRSGVENVKGPARFDSPEQFEYYERNLKQAGASFYSERTLSKKIYATASAASLKGYNYESGLDILTYDPQYEKFKAFLRGDTRKTSALFAAYFATDLGKLVPSSAQGLDKSALGAQAKQLQTSIADVLLSSQTRSEQEIGRSIRAGKIVGDLTKNANLFINNAGLLSLIAGAAPSEYRATQAEPFVQLQRQLHSALTSKDSADQFVERIIGLFEKARSDEHSLRVSPQYRTFSQESAITRGASVAASLLGLTFQSISYSESQRVNPAARSLIELGLVDQSGQLNKEMLLGDQYRNQVLDLLTRAKADLPSHYAIENLAKRYREDKEADFSQDEAYQKIAMAASNMYAATQTAIPLQVSIKWLPSKILQAAGSKDTAGLEYHYSAAMSKRSVDQMRGYVSDLDTISELTHAYNIMTNFSHNKGFTGLKFISPFAATHEDSVKPYYQEIVKFMEHLTTISTKLNPTSTDVITRFATALVSKDTASMQGLVSSLEAIKDVAHAYTGSVDSFQLRERALALSILSNSERLGSRQNRLVMGGHGPVEPRFDYKKATHIFFDLETIDLIDTARSVHDPLRYPSKISELTYILRNFETGTEQAPFTFTQGKPTSAVPTIEKAIDTLASTINNLMERGEPVVLAGHNIRAFDVPTLYKALELRGVQLSKLRLVDTYADVNISKAAKDFGLTKFKLGTVYEHVELLKLQAIANNATLPQEERARARKMIANGEYGKFAAHEAEADVRANIEVYKFIRDKGLFRERPVISEPNSLGVLNRELGHAYYFEAHDYSRQIAEQRGFFYEVLALSKDVIRDAGKKSILYELNAGRDRYLTGRKTSSEFSNELIYDYTKQLLTLATNERGFLSKHKEASVERFLVGLAARSDLQLESNIKQSLTDDQVSYTDQMQALAKKFLDVQTEMSFLAKKFDGTELAEGYRTKAKRAYQSYMSIYESRVVALPLMDFETTDDANTHRVRLASTGSLRGNKAMHGNSLLLLGLDVLNQLPKDFETYTPEIIRHRAELDKVLPEYFDVVEKVQRRILGGEQATISSYEKAVVQRMESLAYKNRQLIFENSIGDFAQRAFGEKTKNLGVSATAVASYLTKIDEIVLGSRFTKVLGTSDISAANRAGGPSLASQGTQAHKVVKAKDIAGTDVNSYVNLDAEANATTAILPIFGRFGMQGGDFDGDSYSIIARYQNEKIAFEKLKSEKAQLEGTVKYLERDIKRYSSDAPEVERAISFIEGAEASGQRPGLAALAKQLEGMRGGNRIFEAFVEKRSQASTNIYIDRVLGNIESWAADYSAEYKAYKAASYVTEGWSEGAIYDVLSRRGRASKQDFAFVADYNRATKEVENFLRANELGSIVDSTKEKYSNKYDYAEQLRREAVSLAASMNADPTRIAISAFAEKVASIDPTNLNKETLNFIRGNQQVADAFGMYNKEMSVGIKEQADNVAYEWLKKALQNKLLKSRQKEEENRDYLAYLQDSAVSYAANLELVSKEVARKQASMDGLSADIENLGIKAVDSMRRHVASYMGLPEAFLSSKTGLFTASDAFLMIEQQRGITPGLEDADKNALSKGGNLMDTVFNVLKEATTHSAFLTSERTDANTAARKEALQSILHGIAVEPVEGTAPGDRRKKAAEKILDFVNRQIISTEDFVNLNPAERLNAVIKDLTDDSLANAMQTIGKITSQAGGTAISGRAFQGLQSVIGSAGTSLIGEAYNAITTLATKTIIARSISESFGSDALQRATGVSSGVDTGDTTGPTMFDLTQQRFDELFPDTYTPGSKATDRDAEVIQEAKGILKDLFTNRDSVDRFISHSFERAQNLTGILGNVQQMVRDSLKAKQDGGMLESIMTSSINDRGNTILEVLTSETTSNDERATALRTFLGEYAGESIFNVASETSYQRRSEVTAFGSLFLLADYMRVEDQDFGQLIHPYKNAKDEFGVQKYAFLEERHARITKSREELVEKQMAEGLNAAEAYKLDTYDKMLTDQKEFVGQSVLDLLNVSLAQRRVYEAGWGGKEYSEKHLQQMQKVRLSVMASLGNEEAADRLREQHGVDTEDIIGKSFDFSGKNGAAFRQELADAMQVTLDGKDLLASKSPDELNQLAEHLGMPKKGLSASDLNAQDYNQQSFDLHQRMAVQFLNVRQKYTGIDMQDLNEMRENMKATQFLRFGTIEGSLTFKNFVERSASAIDAINTQLMRDQITDPRQMNAVIYDAGAQMFEAMGALHEDLKGMYGEAATSLFRDPSKPDAKSSQLPLDVLRAYRSTQNIFGIFDRMLDDKVDPEVRKKVAEMFSLSMNTRTTEIPTGAEGGPTKSVSGYSQMGYMLAGLAQIEKNEAALARAIQQQQDPSAVEPEAFRMQEAYAKALKADQEMGRAKSFGTNTIDFLTGLGHENFTSRGLHTISLDEQNKRAEAEMLKQSKASLLSAFAAPALLTIVGSNIEPDANLINRGLDLVQAAAQIQEMSSAPRKGFTSASLFQIDRMNRTIKEEGLLLGAARAMSSELMFETISRFSNQALARGGTRSGSIIAELVSTSVALAVANATTDRKYGANKDSEEAYMAQAFYELPQLGIGIAASAMEELLNNNSMEADEEEIAYDINMSTEEGQLQQDIETNYSRLDINDEFGNSIDTSFTMDEYAAAYNPIRS